MQPQLFNEQGNVLPVTVIQAGPCTVTEVRSSQRDGYAAEEILAGVTRALPRNIWQTVAAEARSFNDLLPRYQQLASEPPADDVAYIDRACDLNGQVMLNITLVGGFAWKAEAAVASASVRKTRPIAMGSLSPAPCP